MKNQLKNFINFGLIFLHQNYFHMQIFGMKEKLIIDMNLDLFKKKIKEKEMLLKVSI